VFVEVHRRAKPHHFGFIRIYNCALPTRDAYFIELRPIQDQSWWPEYGRKVWRSMGSLLRFSATSCGHIYGCDILNFRYIVDTAVIAVPTFRSEYTHVGFYVSVKSRRMINVLYPHVLNVPIVDHHVPRVPVETIRPVVVSLIKHGSLVFIHRHYLIRA